MSIIIHNSISKFIGNFPLFKMTAQPIAGFFPALAYANEYFEKFMPEATWQP